MNMVHIQTCNVTECAYNKHRQCHALAITVGDEGGGAMCDTFWKKKEQNIRAGDPTQTGHVGACRASSCIYNDRLECSAEGVTIGCDGDKADCLTFNPED